jgi:hypothetical protein
MGRVIAVTACGFILAACSMSMPSLDFLKSTPSTEQLRIESEPPGADATTSQGQTCRTPCELTVPTTSGELSVTFALNGYQQMTVPVRPDGPGGGAQRLQPNPVYAELQPMNPPKPTKKKRAPAKKRTVAKKQTAAPEVAEPAPAPASAPPPMPATTPAPSTAFPSSGGGYPWPPAPQ